MQLSPEPRVHAAHRRANYQPKTIDFEPLRQQPALGEDHVVVTVSRKFCPHQVARLGGFSMSQVVRNDDEKTRRVKELAFAEKFAGESRPDKGRAVAAGAMQYQHRIPHHALLIGLWLSQGAVMYSDFRQRLSSCETEVPEREVAVDRLRIFRRGSMIQSGDDKNDDKQVPFHLCLT